MVLHELTFGEREEPTHRNEMVAAMVLRRRPSQSDLALPHCSHLILLSLSSSKPSCLTSLSHWQDSHLDTSNTGLGEFGSHTSGLSFMLCIWCQSHFKTTLMAFSCRAGRTDPPALAAGYLSKQVPAAFCSACSASSKVLERHHHFPPVLTTM